MRRNDKQILDNDIIENFMRAAQVCRLGLVDNGLAYIVPIHHIFDNGCVFFHSAKAGKKVELLKNSKVISFEVDHLNKIASLEPVCKSSSSYISIMGQGDISLVESAEQKQAVLSKLMLKLADKVVDFATISLENINIYQIKITKLSCKKSL